MKKPRGRPRAFEPDQALAQAMAVFRAEGFAATSLDDLSAATGLNRPSLYGAFGDKRELYLKTYERYRADARGALAQIFAADAPLRERLARIFSVALDIYLAGRNGPSGCFTVLTAASEIVADDEVRAVVLDALRDLDAAFRRCFDAAIARGELPHSTDASARAQLAAATLHSLSVRARARVPRQELDAMIEGAVALLGAA